jgi:hypothetical protein
MSFEWLPSVPIRREVLTIRGTVNNSTTRADLLATEAGVRFNVVDVACDFKGATANGIEVYFDTGANIDADDNKYIMQASQAAIGVVLFKYDDEHRPRGAVADVISVRGILAVAEDIDVTVRYWRD